MNKEPKLLTPISPDLLIRMLNWGPVWPANTTIGVVWLAAGIDGDTTEWALTWDHETELLKLTERPCGPSRGLTLPRQPRDYADLIAICEGLGCPYRLSDEKARGQADRVRRLGLSMRQSAARPDRGAKRPTST